MDSLDNWGVGDSSVGDYGLVFLLLDFGGIRMLNGFADQAEGLLG